MNNRQMDKTLVIGAREIAWITSALAVLSVAIVIFLLGVNRLNSARGASQPGVFITLTATNSLGEGSPESQASPVLAWTLTPLPATAPVLAPTFVPTVETAEHIVQPGQSLTSIAVLYGVDMQALAEANGLTLDSVIVAGQRLIVPLVPGNEGTYHEVQEGETLSTIAALYGVSPEALQSANNLEDADAIFQGQRLYIPAPAITPTPIPDAASPTPAPTSEFYPDLLANGPRMSSWPRSLMAGDLDTNYPLMYDGERFRMHYQPDTYAEDHLEETVEYITNGLALAESTLGVQLDGTFDIYVAGTLFDRPNTSLRGFSESRDRRIFILHDGSGTPVDNAYFFAHEITHLVAWNTWGQPASTMLSEGLATHVGQPILEQGGYLPYDQICLAINAVGRSESMAAINTDFQAFNGHIRAPFNYFSSACFVDWLIDQYGIAPLAGVYHTSDYPNLYGTSLFSLDADWHANLESRGAELSLDAEAFASRTDRVSHAYAYVFGSYNGSETMHVAYAMVDRARVALWQGNFPEVDRWLTEFTNLTGFVP